MVRIYYYDDYDYGAFRYLQKYKDLINKYLNLNSNPCVHEFLVAVNDSDDVIGGVTIQKPYYCLGIIKYLVVDERYRNRGIGTKLLFEAECRLKEKGINVIFITVNPKVSRLGFYIKRGYRVLSFFKNKYGNEVFALYKVI